MYMLMVCVFECLSLRETVFLLGLLFFRLFCLSARNTIRPDTLFYLNMAVQVIILVMFSQWLPKSIFLCVSETASRKYDRILPNISPVLFASQTLRILTLSGLCKNLKTILSTVLKQDAQLQYILFSMISKLLFDNEAAGIINPTWQQLFNMLCLSAPD